MNRRFWPALLLAFPGLVGCTPPGPSDFYRSALQARSEFVDSLARVVDEKSAKDKFQIAEKVMNDRINEIKEALDRAKYDNIFRKLSADNFSLKNVGADDKEGMISGIKAYAFYCKNVGFTNVRLKREIQRLKMVQVIETLNKARAQKESNQPVAVNKDNDCPNLAQLLTSLEKGNQTNLRFVPQDVTVEGLKKLNSNIPEDEMKFVIQFDPAKLDDVPGFEAPGLPDYPAWAYDIDQRFKLGLTQKPPAKKR